MTIGNPFAHRSLAPLVHSQQSHGGTISAPRGHKNWQSFFKHSGTSTNLSTLSHELHEAQDKASAVFSNSLIHLGSRMAFRLDGLITSSESWEGNASQWRRQARAIVQDLLTTDLLTDFAVYAQVLQKSVNHLFQTASHITLKSASSYVRNVLSKATEMIPGQATYFLC